MHMHIYIYIQILALPLRVGRFLKESPQVSVCGSRALLRVNACTEYSSNLLRSGVKVSPPTR